MQKKDSESSQNNSASNTKDALDMEYMEHVLANPNEVSERDETNSRVTSVVKLGVLEVLGDMRLLQAGKLSVGDLQADLAMTAKGLADKMALKVMKELETGLTDKAIKGALATSELIQTASIALTQFQYHKSLEQGAAQRPSLVSQGIVPKSLRGRITQEQRADTWEATTLEQKPESVGH